MMVDSRWLRGGYIRLVGMELCGCHAPELLAAVFAEQASCLLARLNQDASSILLCFLEFFDGFVGVVAQPVHGGSHYVHVSGWRSA